MSDDKIVVRRTTKDDVDQIVAMIQVLILHE